MEEIMDNPLYLYDLEYKNVIGVDEAGATGRLLPFAAYFLLSCCCRNCF